MKNVYVCADSMNRKKMFLLHPHALNCKQTRIEEKKNALCVYTCKTVEIGCYLEKNEEEDDDGGGRSNSFSMFSICRYFEMKKNERRDVTNMKHDLGREEEKK